MKEKWLIGPDDDDLPPEYCEMWYTPEDARYCVLMGFAGSIIKKYNKPRKCRPFETGESFGIPWIERYFIVDRLAHKLLWGINQRLKNLELKKYYYS